MDDRPCDVRGATALREIKCKVICRNCGTFVQSCADLAQWSAAPAAPPTGR